MKLWRYGQSVESLGRRYRLDGMLGSGGMADVCLAWDEREQREVALKILKSDDLDQETLNRFMKEAAQIADWQHPHILRVYESLQVELIDAASGSVLFYMVSEYARGGDLQKRLTPGRAFPLSACFALFRQLCDAVQYAHERGVIHRDLKPLNMLFRRPESGPEEVVLSDFGLAVQVDASHHTFAHGGTLAYMAPEQFQGHALPASDIFALGVILYLLCTGGLPFRRTLQDMPRIVQGHAPLPTRPSMLNSELPPALDDVILRAVRELPAERYRQPREFWQAIELALTMSAPTFPFVDELWHNAGQTWPYDGLEQPQRSLQAGQQRQSPGASASLPGEAAPEVEEGSVSALWIAREKQKASPVRLPLPTNSILAAPSEDEDDGPEQAAPVRGVSATWQPANERDPRPRDPSPFAPGGSTTRARPISGNAGNATRPAARSSGSTILPAPRADARAAEQTSRRRQAFEPPAVFAKETERPINSQPSTASERQSSRSQPFELFEPPDALAEEAERQTSRKRASHQLSDASERQSSRRPPPASGASPARRVPASIPIAQGRRVSRGASAPPGRQAARSPLPAQGPRGRGVPLSARRAATRKRVPLIAILCGLAILILILAIFAATSFQGPLLTFFGAPVTRVTLQARAQMLQQSIDLSAVFGVAPDPGANQIQARFLDNTSPSQSAPVNATGSIKGKQATGILTLINNTSSNITVGPTVITDNSGIQVSFHDTVIVPAAPPSSISVLGFAVQPGAAGNITVLDIVKSCCAAGIIVKNTSAFTGGQDAQPNSIIQQSDIDRAAAPLVAAGKTSALANLQGRARSTERVAANTARCQPLISSDQKAGDQAKSATVQVNVTCSETVYDDAQARQLVTRQLQSQVNADPHLGAGYALAGQLALNLTTVQVISDQQDKLTFQAGGLWAYQFTPAVLHGFASLIAGKSQSAARALLLRQPGVSSVQFSNSNILPVNTGEIQVSAQTQTS